MNIVALLYLTIFAISIGQLYADEDPPDEPDDSGNRNDGGNSDPNEVDSGTGGGGSGGGGGGRAGHPCDVRFDDEYKIDDYLKEKVEIKDCHYKTHSHPRQDYFHVPFRTDDEATAFHHLAIFNIKYDLDFQEAGDRCNVRLHQEWLLGESGPVALEEFSFNRIWYERMCNPFSFLECIPWDEVRTKPKKEGQDTASGSSKTKKMQASNLNPHANHTHPGALPDKHKHLPPDNDTKAKLNLPSQELPRNLFAPTKRPRDPEHTTIEYKDSGRDTSLMKRLYIGGRGPGKGRHKSGPGSQRVDPGKLIGVPQAIPVEGYELDGICVCSAFDPKYPDRNRPKYGMDFVEDEARPDWCVAAPGQLCGRVHFQRDIWPSQDFIFADHIPCAQKYHGESYECIRWSLAKNKDNKEAFEVPHTLTATCEHKQEIRSEGLTMSPSILLMFYCHCILSYTIVFKLVEILWKL